jgi:hypothetical protein
MAIVQRLLADGLIAEEGKIPASAGGDHRAADIVTVYRARLIQPSHVRVMRHAATLDGSGWR